MGVSSRFGRQLTEQLLECGERGERIVGTVRRLKKVANLFERHPERFGAELLDVTDTTPIRDVVDRSFAQLRSIDLIVRTPATASSEPSRRLTNEQIDHLMVMRVVGFDAAVSRAAAPECRGEHHPRVLLPHNVAFPGSSLHHATEVGHRGLVESVARGRPLRLG